MRDNQITERVREWLGIEDICSGKGRTNKVISIPCSIVYRWVPYSALIVEATSEQLENTRKRGIQISPKRRVHISTFRRIDIVRPEATGKRVGGTFPTVQYRAKSSEAANVDDMSLTTGSNTAVNAQDRASRDAEQQMSLVALHRGQSVVDVDYTSESKHTWTWSG